MRRQLFSGDGARAGFCVFRHAQFHQRDQTTKILITLAGPYQDGDRADFGRRELNTDFGADMGRDTVLLRREMKPGRTVTPSRSSKAMAGICNSWPAAISSSGTDAPSRKLKADRA